MLETISQTVSFICQKTKSKPKIGIVLGTGLSGLANEIKQDAVISYKDIPNFPVSTVESHPGKLIFGTLGKHEVVAMQGRFHYYEGYSTQQIAFPIRVLKALGIEYLFLSNACGGLNPTFEVGDLMIIDDHINLIPNPLIGKHYDEFGPRFPDMSCPYNTTLINKAINIAQKQHLKIHKGCYVAVTGPSLETPKEYHFLRVIGGDAVGMSTVPEVITARQMNITCFAISIITDLGVPGKIKEVSLDEIIKASEIAEPKMTAIFRELINDIE
jgi:purine-nucleoside phosphorylase